MSMNRTNRGRLLFGYFFFGEARKVVGCRVTPDEVDFDVGLRNETANPTYSSFFS